MVRKTLLKCPEGAGGGAQPVGSAGFDLGCGPHSWKHCCRHTTCGTRIMVHSMVAILGSIAAITPFGLTS